MPILQEALLGRGRIMRQLYTATLSAGCIKKRQLLLEGLKRACAGLHIMITGQVL